MSTRKRFVAGVAVGAMLALTFAPAGAGSSGGSRFSPAVLDRVLAAELAKARPLQVFDTTVSAWDKSALRQLDRMKVRHRKLQALPIAFARLTLAQIARLLGTDGIRSVYAPKKLRTMLNESTAMIGARDVTDRLGIDGTGATVALIDTGVDTLHPDLTLGEKVLYNYEVLAPALTDDTQALIVESPNTDDNGHGTHVAGTIAGFGAGSPEGMDYRGVAPGAKLIAYSANIPEVGFLDQYLVAAFDHILSNVKETSVRAINLSIGGADGFDYDPNAPEAISSKALYDAGIVVVFAAGNSGAPNDVTPDGTNTLSQQCVSPYVVCVAAMTKHRQIHTFSSVGRATDNQDRALAQRYDVGVYRPTIAAPGVWITAPAAAAAIADADDSTQPHGYMTISGTSMAAPHITGVVALLVAANPKLTVPEIIRILESTADRLPGRDAHEAGPGAVNVRRAVAAALALKDGRRLVLPTPSFDYAPPARTATQIAKISGTALTGSWSHGQGIETHEFTVPPGIDRMNMKLTWTVPSNLYAFVWGPGDEPADDPIRAPFATQEVWGLNCTVGGRVDAPCAINQRQLSISYPEPGTWKMRVYARTVGSPYEVTWEGLRYALPSVKATVDGTRIFGTSTFPQVESEPRTIAAVAGSRLFVPNPTLKPRTVYFHGTGPLGNLDVAQGADPAWNDEAPTSAVPKSSHGVGFVGDPATDGDGPVLARFSGVLQRPIEGDVDVVFWVGSTYGALADFEVAILAGDRVVGTATTANDIVAPEAPVRVVATVPDVRLPAGTKITVQIAGVFVDSSAHYAVYYDSASMPSGLILPEVTRFSEPRGVLEIETLLGHDLRTGAVRLSWPKTEGARRYRVFRGTDPQGLEPIAVVSQPSAGKALPPVVVEGEIAVGTPATEVLTSVTRGEFILTCNPEPRTQGTDGWVITLPEGSGDGLQRMTVTGSGGEHDLEIYFYDSECSPTGDIATEEPDEAGPIPAGSAYAVVDLWIGVGTSFTATITRAAETPSDVATLVRGLPIAVPAYFRVAAIDANGLEGPLSDLVAIRPTTLERTVEVSLDGERWVSVPLTLSDKGRRGTWSVDVAPILARASSGVSAAATARSAVLVRARASDAASAPVWVEVLGAGVRPIPRPDVLPATGVGAGLAGLAFLAAAGAVGLWQRRTRTA